MKNIITYEKYYNNQKPKFEIGDKVYFTNIKPGSIWSVLDTEYTINNYQIQNDIVYYELKEIPKPNNYQEFRFSTPAEYYQMKYNI